MHAAPMCLVRTNNTRSPGRIREMSKSLRPARPSSVVRMAIQRAMRGSALRRLATTVPAATLMALAATGAATADDDSVAADATGSAAAANTFTPPAKVDETSDLDKVVVHARNRLEPLKDVPISISVVEG